MEPSENGYILVKERKSVNITMKRIFALLVLCLMLVPLCAGSALADQHLPLDLDRLNSLKVCAVGETYKDLNVEEALSFDLFYVAETEYVPGYDTYSFRTVEDFSALEEWLLQAENEETDWETVAQQALLIATGYADGFEDPTVWAYNSELPLNELIGGEEGVFPSGLYLILVHGRGQGYGVREHIDEDTGEVTYSTSAFDGNADYTFWPILISLPQKDSSDNWSYSEELFLKGEKNERLKKKLTLHKKSEEGENLEGAQFKLYATRLADPYAPGVDPQDTITTYVEGQGYVTLYRAGTYRTDKNGSIELDAPLLDDNTLYAWVETVAPNGYELDETPHFFYAYGENDEDYFFDYAGWMNEPGNYGDSHLLYDPDFLSDVSFHRAPEGDSSVVTFYVAESCQPVYVRVKWVGSCEGVLNGESLADFYATVTGGGWSGPDAEGYFCYTEILYGGQETSPVRFTLDGSETENEDGTLISRAYRVAVVYDYIPVQYDQDGNPISPFDADWGWDPRDSEGGELNRLPGGSLLQPMARGGYVLRFPDLRFSGRPHRVESYGLQDEGVTIRNRKKPGNPPDEPGFELPETGGMGTFAFTFAGLGIVAIALFLFAVRKRERE